MSTSTELYLPPELPYPIKIAAHAVRISDNVDRGTRLLSYSYVHTSPAESEPETRFGTWDSTIEGTVDRWGFRQGETVSARKARDAAAIYIIEPCKHGVQLGGLCCLCGKDMTDSDYTGFSNTSRASIQMTHLANGPLVSLEEAQRIERETAQHLVSQRKLSLIVDLDQTIVHATVDPTVEEWITEGEAWEERQAKKSESAQNKEDSDGTVSDADDEVNPNWEALKDVKKFRLGPEALGQPSFRGPRSKGKEKAIDNEGCMYYIKPRPGWKEFLEAMSAKYEMHVYTMGTRAYAEEVCAAIDPEGKYFGGRLLSRDESGSLTQKSLQRLFPTDQSMVVIIDDRADVWEWSPNLVKVIPYDFFVGIGDINSAFLPKLNPMAPAVPPTPPPTSPDAASGSSPSSEAAKDSTPTSPPTTPSSPSSTTTAPAESSSAEELSKSEILKQNTMALEAQVEERPLAKKQEALQEASTEGQANGQITLAPANGSTPASSDDKTVRKALLKNDDAELQRVQKILEEIHLRFYDEYDARTPDGEQGSKKGKRRTHLVSYDVRSIIPRIRMDTLEGVHILFSSVIPLDTRPEATEIWRTAHHFGAKCYMELSRRITHVVAAKRGTQKVDAARRMGGIKVVWVSWFTDSIALWQRQNETPYLLDPDPPPQASAASPPSDSHQISSDPEPDADDWDVERAAPGKEGLELDEVDWDEINDEVEAAMNESDDDGASERSGMRSENVSDDENEWTDESNSIISSTTSSPRLKRKRLRSITPSDIGLNGEVDPDILRSRLAKRKKIAADRSGTSKLKEAITAADLVSREPTDDEGAPSKVSTPARLEEDDEITSDESDDGDDAGMEDDDDFLTRELGEDWG